MKICCSNDKKNNKHSNKQTRILFAKSNFLLCSIYMDSVILQSVFPFSEGLNSLKEVGVSLIFVLERFIPDQTEFFKLTTQACN